MELLRQIEIVDRIIFHIEKNFHEINCLQDIHHRIFVDCPIYEKVFQEQTRLTIDQYVNKVRTEQAAQLLKETQLDVKEVALVVGISSYFEFAHIFEELMGVNPGQYRNQVCDGKVNN